jgi:acyl-CoA thioester hydrolase
MIEHSLTVRVRYGETDQMGVVYHSNYLLYFEMGRTELMRAAGLAYRELEERGIFLVVTESACRHRAAARYDDLLRVTTRVTRLGKATIRFEYDVDGPDGKRIAEGHTELAALGRDRSPTRLPDEIANHLKP